MNPLQQCKFAECIPPGVIKDDASHVAVVIDTLGFDYLTVVLDFGAMDIAMAALTLVESDDNSTNINIESANFGNSSSTDLAGSALALPISTADNTLRVIQVDLRKRKRYIQLLSTGGNGSTGTYAAAIAILSRGETPLQTCAGLAGTAGIVVRI